MLRRALRDASPPEIDPASLPGIVWQYTPKEAGFLEPMDSNRFYSPFISGAAPAQRQYLITEGSDGRVFGYPSTKSCGNSFHRIGHMCP